MKYIIRYGPLHPYAYDPWANPANTHDPIHDDTLYLYHKKCFVTEPGQDISGSQSKKISEAVFFDNYDDAEHIVKMAYSIIYNSEKKYSKKLQIIPITEKEIFTAKLAGK